MLITKPVDLPLLSRELTAAGVPFNGLGTSGTTPEKPDEQDLHQFDQNGQPLDLPPEAVPVVNAHVAPPPLGDFATATEVHALAQTTDDVPKEVFRFPCAQRRRYTASLTISGIDRANFVSRDMDGRFVWKRVTGNAVMVGITVVSTLGEAASASWAPNAVASGTDIVFMVKGAAGRTIDWLLVGGVQVYSPEGL